MRWTSVLVLTLLVGCDSPPASSEGSALKPSGSAKPASSGPTKSSAAGGTSTPAAPKLCEKADKLQKRLADIDATAERVSIGSDVALPESKDGEKVSSMWMPIVIGPKDIRVGGESVTKPADVKGKLRDQSKFLLAIPKGEEGIGRIADVVAALGPDAEVYLIAAVPGAKLEAPPKDLKLEGGTSERARIMAEALSKSIDGCSEAKKVFQDLASSDPGGRGESVKKDLPVAINKCGCKVADNTEDMIAFLLAGDPPVVGKKLKVSKEKDAKEIKLKGLDGQKLYDALPSDGSAVRLEK